MTIDRAIEAFSGEIAVSHFERDCLLCFDAVFHVWNGETRVLAVIDHPRQWDELMDAFKFVLMQHGLRISTNRVSWFEVEDTRFTMLTPQQIAQPTVMTHHGFTSRQRHGYGLLDFRRDRRVRIFEAGVPAFSLYTTLTP